MNAQELSTLAGMLLSLGFAYIPGVSEWYAALDSTRKRLVMLGLLALVACGALGLSCAGWLELFRQSGSTPPTCDRAGLSGLLLALVSAVVANQGTYLLLPKRGCTPAPLNGSSSHAR